MVIDFGLYHSLKEESYTVLFFDRYLDRNYLDELNEEMHFFLNSWYKDKDGRDLFAYNGISFGDSFLLSILTEVSFFTHFFISFIHLKELSYKRLFVALDNDLLSILNKTGLAHKRITQSEDKFKQVYYFPIKQWMASAISSNSLRSRTNRLFARTIDYLLSFLDLLLKPKSRVFIQEYHPTNAIIDELRQRKELEVITSSFTGKANFLKERRVHYKTFKNAHSRSFELYNNARLNKVNNWSVQGVDIAVFLYEIIFRIIEGEISHTCSDIQSIEAYFKKNRPLLMIPVTDLWSRNALIMAYCRKNRIPIYFVTNGILASSYWQDAKYATWVNCFSEAVRQGYFRSDEKVKAIGDPRMDFYQNIDKKSLNFDCPTITIGTSGFSPVDLNSFLAVEYEFLFDVLKTLLNLKDQDYKFNLQIKVRPNGYLEDYKSFVSEYFPALDVTFFHQQSFKKVIQATDLYITIYSQTLFEAAAMGIPSIYYKNDRQLFFEPFSKTAGLTIAENVEELQSEVETFYLDKKDSDLFLSQEQLVRAIGPLDGMNLKRNLEFIEEQVLGDVLKRD